MADIVILGAGPTGLSTAYHLEKHQFYDYKLFEKEATVGGLCRSVIQDGFTFDFTGHLLHINDPYFKTFIESITESGNWQNIFRRSFVYSQNTYTPYPYQVNLYGLPASTIAQCIEDFVKRPKTKAKPKTFYDWVLKNFGASLGKYFFFPYQQKIFSYPVKKLSASWTGRFVPSTSLKDMIYGAISDRSKETFGYNAQFLYPISGGIQYWVDQLAQKLTNTYYTGFCIKSIDVVNKKITFTNGAQENFKKIISTIPLDYLLTILQGPSNTSLNKAADKLICNSVVNFNLGINRSEISDKHWIYFPEKKYPFYRLGFPHNFSSTMTPDGCSSLYGEFSYINKPQSYINKKLKLALECTQKLLNIDKTDILTEKIINIKHAYVIYNSWRDKNILNIIKQLEDYNIYSIGRYGHWKYSSMQEAVLDGKFQADLIINSITV